MTKKSRAAALMLAVLFAFAVVFSCLVIVGESGHECSGADCEICFVIAACVSFLGNLRSLTLIVLFAFAVVCGMQNARAFCFVRRNGATPVTLKTRLLN
ncbi:MAG: hypothetical protein IK085_04275 [Clostridia bacterium]|nr:hypothetical protein [Clostridia bacterium]